MIQEIDANLLEYPLQGIIHQANCFQTMGAGIAKRIKDKYPEAFVADLKAGGRGESKRLGTFSVAHCERDGKYIYNLYGQFNYGHYARFTSYDAVSNGLVKIARHAIENNITTLGLPKNMGCINGGGDWRIVRAIIETVFDTDSGLELYICNYQA